MANESGGTGESTAVGEIGDWSTTDAGSLRPEWEIITSRGYEPVRQLGRGQYGTAHLVRRRGETADPVVAKVVFLDHLKSSDRKLALQEVEVLGRLSHPNIVSHLESWLHVSRTGQEALVNIMDFCAGGDLRAWLEDLQQQGNHLAESAVLDLFAQMLHGICYVHAQNILHRDLKTSNMLLDRAHQNVMIGDFGIARVLESTVAVAITTLGTPYYMSPEVCKGEPYRDKSDMWSLGCVLYEMCVLRRAFQSQSLLGLVYCIVSERYDPIPVDRYSPALADLISRLLAKPADQRPSALETLRLEVFCPYNANGTYGHASGNCTATIAPPVATSDPRSGVDMNAAGHGGCNTGRPPPPPPLFLLEGTALPEPPPTPNVLEPGMGSLGTPHHNDAAAALEQTASGWSPAVTTAIGVTCTDNHRDEHLPSPPPLRRPAPPSGTSADAANTGYGNFIASSPNQAHASRSSAFRPSSALFPPGPGGLSSQSAPWMEASLDVKVALYRARGTLLRRPRAQGNWVQAFALHDSTGQGLLDRAEFESFMSSLDLGLSRREISAVAENLSSRRAMTISLSDFSDAMTHAVPDDGVRQDEAWAAGLCCGLLAGGAATTAQHESPDAISLLLAKLLPTLPADRLEKLLMWLPKTPNGAVDWAAVEEWSHTALSAT